MEDELEAFWKKLSFTKEEDKQMVLGSNSPKATRELGKNCLVIKVLSRRSISLMHYERTLEWCGNRIRVDVAAVGNLMDK